MIDQKGFYYLSESKKYNIHVVVSYLEFQNIFKINLRTIMKYFNKKELKI